MPKSLLFFAVSFMPEKPNFETFDNDAVYSKISFNVKICAELP